MSSGAAHQIGYYRRARNAQNFTKNYLDPRLQEAKLLLGLGSDGAIFVLDEKLG